MSQMRGHGPGASPTRQLPSYSSQNSPPQPDPPRSPPNATTVEMSDLRSDDVDASSPLFENSDVTARRTGAPGERRQVSATATTLPSFVEKSLETRMTRSRVPPKKSTLKSRVYNFLERPTGWKCFVYHFLVGVKQRTPSPLHPIRASHTYANCRYCLLL